MGQCGVEPIVSDVVKVCSVFIFLECLPIKMKEQQPLQTVENTGPVTASRTERFGSSTGKIHLLYGFKSKQNFPVIITKNTERSHVHMLSY